ncbi:methionine--tRNA ligase [Nonomuraea sp. NPDC026600]|uniref:methionine--tRNA ligase n=1 Tax=Nonomuraea sp. NPDC026600 TaxID=3155363 RepID=UPI00340674F0
MYITTTIPYVNARPHLGHALEIVQGDVLARHYRRRGEPVRFQTGTDDNSLKNVLAAEAEGVPVRELVDRNAAAFEGLRESYDLSFDSFIRTSHHPGHRPGVERIWRTIDGDLYQRHYEGLYCVGCEQFCIEGPCPEHEAPLQRVSEKNWFFRLSRYQDALLDLIRGGRLRIEPAARRNEVLAFIEAGLADISVSRSADRARGWGIPVPGDPSQVVYVWWDALANYVTALDGGDYDRWWVAEPRKVHLMGKGVIRFHAVYWPAMLLAAGLPLPAEIFVHDYLTVGGRKISKSSGTSAVAVDAVAGRTLVEACESAPGRVHEALEGFDFRRAAAAVWTIVEEANKYVERVKPWRQEPGDRETSLATLVYACRVLAGQLAPFLPTGAARVAAAVSGERLADPEPLFPRLAG